MERDEPERALTSVVLEDEPRQPCLLWRSHCEPDRLTQCGGGIARELLKTPGLSLKRLTPRQGRSERLPLHQPALRIQYPRISCLGSQPLTLTEPSPEGLISGDERAPLNSFSSLTLFPLSHSLPAGGEELKFSMDIRKTEAGAAWRTVEARQRLLLELFEISALSQRGEASLKRVRLSVKSA